MGVWSGNNSRSVVVRLVYVFEYSQRTEQRSVEVIIIFGGSKSRSTRRLSVVVARRTQCYSKAPGRVLMNFPLIARPPPIVRDVPRHKMFLIVYTLCRSSVPCFLWCKPLAQATVTQRTVFNSARGFVCLSIQCWTCLIVSCEYGRKRRNCRVQQDPIKTSFSFAFQSLHKY